MVFIQLFGENNAQRHNYFDMESTRPNYYDILKVTAIVFMIIDHIWYFFFPEYLILRVLWRISMPLFLFLAWYSWSSRFPLKLIFWFFLVDISFFSYSFFFSLDNYVVSILWSILFVKFFLFYLNKFDLDLKKTFYLMVFLILVCISLTPYFYYIVDYGWLAIAIALLGTLYKKFYTTSYKIFLFPILICVMSLFMYWQIKSFVFSGIYLNLFYLLSFLLIVAFIYLPSATISLQKSKLSRLILFMSTYSLSIYIGHLLLFVFLSFIFTFYVWSL